MVPAGGPAFAAFRERFRQGDFHYFLFSIIPLDLSFFFTQAVPSGASVKRKQLLVTVESMKMEMRIHAEADGVFTAYVLLSPPQPSRHFDRLPSQRLSRPSFSPSRTLPLPIPIPRPHRSLAKPGEIVKEGHRLGTIEAPAAAAPVAP